MCKIISNQSIKEIIIKVKKGVLIGRVSEKEIQIWYKPSINYGVQYHLIGFPDMKPTETQLIDILEYIYEDFQPEINFTLYEIWKGSCPSDVSEYFCMRCFRLKEECTCSPRMHKSIINVRSLQKGSFCRLN